MALRRPDGAPSRVPVGTTDRQLSQQVLPFIRDLPCRYADGAMLLYGYDLAPVERVAPCSGLDMYGIEVGANSCERRFLRTKPLPLRMIAATSGLAPEDRLRKQRLAPKRNAPPANRGTLDATTRGAW